MTNPANFADEANVTPDRARLVSALYDEHAPALLAYLLARMNREDAEDVAQTVWHKVFRSFEQFDGGHFRGWLFRIAKRRKIDHHRKSNRDPKSLAEDFDPRDPSDRKAEMAERFEDHRKALRTCIEKLDVDRRLVVQRRMTGISFAEIAAETGIVKETLMTRFHRATAQLRECIKGLLS